MSEQVSLSRSFQCSLCKELFELGALTCKTGENLPYLVVTAEVFTADDAFANVICQRCFGHKSAPSLEDVLTALKFKITPPVKMRVGVSKSVSSASSRVRVGAMPGTTTGRMRVGIATQRSDSVAVAVSVEESGGARAVVASAPETDTARLRVGSKKPVKQFSDAPPARGREKSHETQEPPRDEWVGWMNQGGIGPASATIGESVKQRLDAIKYGSNSIAATISAAAQLGVEHKLTAKERAVYARVRRAKFAATIGKLKRLVGAMREFSSRVLCEDLFSDIHDALNKACVLDANNRSKDDILAMAWTSSQELESLRLFSYTTVGVSVDKNGKASFIAREQKLRAQNGRFERIQIGVPQVALAAPKHVRYGSIREVDVLYLSGASDTALLAGNAVEPLPDMSDISRYQTKIVYAQNECYGTAYAKMTSNRHLRKRMHVHGLGEVEVLRKGSLARMVYQAASVQALAPDGKGSFFPTWLNACDVRKTFGLEAEEEFTGQILQIQDGRWEYIPIEPESRRVLKEHTFVGRTTDVLVSVQDCARQERCLRENDMLPEVSNSNTDLNSAVMLHVYGPFADEHFRPFTVVSAMCHDDKVRTLVIDLVSQMVPDEFVVCDACAPAPPPPLVINDNKPPEVIN